LPFRALAFVPATQSGRNRASVLAAIKFKKSPRSRHFAGASRQNKYKGSVNMFARWLNGFFSGYLAAEFYTCECSFEKQRAKSAFHN